MEALNWLFANWEGLLAAVFPFLFALHALALFIVNLTDTPDDNEAVGKFYKLIEWMAGVFSYKAKQLPGEANADL